MLRPELDAVLREIRSLTGPDHELDDYDVDRLIELVQKLDADLSTGEPLPSDWASGEKTGIFRRDRPGQVAQPTDPQAEVRTYRWVR